MSIEDRDSVKAGVKLVARYKGALVECAVGKGEGDALTYTVGDKVFNSVSKAGSHAAGGTSVNGFRFWSLDGQLPEGRKAAEPKPKAEKPAKAPKAPKASNPVIKKSRKQPDDLGEGEAEYFCSGCMKPFRATGDKPTACPEGHGEAIAADTAEAPAADAETAPAEGGDEPVELEI